MTDEAEVSDRFGPRPQRPTTGHNRRRERQRAAGRERVFERARHDERATTSRRRSGKSREGVVVSQKMDKTVVVAVIERVRHPKYNKFVLQTKRLYAHDEANDVNVGDKVRVMETRPLSKTKRWRVAEDPRASEVESVR